jgi:hypothetical protein
MQVTVRGTELTLTPLLVAAFVLGVAVAGYGAYDYVQQTESVDEAVAVDTTVVETSVSESSGRRVSYRVSVTHAYEYQGTEYTSTRVFPGETSPTYFVRTDAVGVADEYDSGTTTTAYVPPDAPGRAFLKRQTTLAPVKFVGFGGVVALLAALRALGPRNPMEDTAGAGDLRQYETVLWMDRGTVRNLSKRLLKIAPVVFVVTLVATVFLVLSADSSSIQADLTDPVGVTLLAMLASLLAFLGGLALYGGWSFTESRRLRRELAEPRPRSPFRHPSLFVSVLTTSEDLDDYGQQVKRTGFAFATTVFLTALLAFVLWTAG